MLRRGDDEGGEGGATVEPPAAGGRAAPQTPLLSPAASGLRRGRFGAPSLRRQLAWRGEDKAELRACLPEAALNWISLTANLKQTCA